MHFVISKKWHNIITFFSFRIQERNRNWNIFRNMHILHVAQFEYVRKNALFSTRKKIPSHFAIRDRSRYTSCCFETFITYYKLKSLPDDDNERGERKRVEFVHLGNMSALFQHGRIFARLRNAIVPRTVN